MGGNLLEHSEQWSAGSRSGVVGNDDDHCPQVCYTELNLKLFSICQGTSPVAVVLVATFTQRKFQCELFVPCVENCIG